MDLVIKALTFWFEHVIQDWMLPGQVENWVFIINMKGMGIAALAVQVNFKITRGFIMVIVCEKTVPISSR